VVGHWSISPGQGSRPQRLSDFKKYGPSLAKATLPRCTEAARSGDIAARGCRGGTPGKALELNHLRSAAMI